jgi:hypothetical protein
MNDSQSRVTNREAFARNWERIFGRGRPKSSEPQPDPKILRNMARCVKCGDVIESKHRHDFVWCKCGAISVDGGKDYLKRVGELQYVEEMSVVAKKRGAR